MIQVGEERLWSYIHDEMHRNNVKNLGFDNDSSGINTFIVCTVVIFVLIFRSLVLLQGGVTVTEFLRIFRDCVNDPSALMRQFEVRNLCALVMITIFN